MTVIKRPGPAEKAALSPHLITRRRFLYLTAMSGAGLAAGCAVNPVTGERQMMLMSEAGEVQIDRQYAPQQFSADYGTIQDAALNAYIDRTGRDIAAITHRPRMPYSFRGVNAAYVNAYAFPGGSIACTRGILLSLDNEAELAALLGHELGHVNARHTAQQMTKSQIANVVVGLGTALVAAKWEDYAWAASGLGAVGAGLLLASYSRDNERQADDLGTEYMAKAGYNPQGMVGLMEMLNSLSKRKPNAIEMMFSTHPMSDERYATTVGQVRTEYAAAKNNPIYRERYMDHTARLRAIKPAVDALQDGEKAMAGKRYDQAESLFKRALKTAPNDYAGMMMMAKCQLVRNKFGEAQRYAESAKSVYPKEAQAYHVAGFAKLKNNRFSPAYRDFAAYERLLPGNPNTTFYQGYCLERMGQKQQAASNYAKYLNAVQQGDQAKYAYQRLVEWGVIKPRKQSG
jgi:beta-barrel assembly-enhancing protease